MIKKANDIKLIVRPITFGAEHLYYYEGPCRFGAGDALQPGYDRLANAQLAKVFYNRLKENAPFGVEILEPVAVSRTDDWDNKDEMWEMLLDAVKGADVLVIKPRIATDDLVLELIERCKMPVIFDPDGLCGIADSAALSAKPKKYTAYAALDWNHVSELLSAFRAAKVIRNTSILCATRFGSTTSMSSVDSFNSFEDITARLGVHFRFVNAHELMDQMSPAAEGGNHTTPGRKTPNLTEQDMEEINAIADELLEGAEEVDLQREYLINSLKAYITVHKLMDLKDCNAFTIPCPDVCSTRRLNEMKFTFCLTHSLNTEMGIPSACEYDVSGALSQQALAAVSQQAPYMGNGYPVLFNSDGKCRIQRISPEENAILAKDPENLYAIGHSVAHRHLLNMDRKNSYALRHFAYDQKFGAIIRHDFNEDIGKTITIARFSADGKRLFIGRGEVTGGAGYRVDNCNNPVVFRVKNQRDFFEKQAKCGMHLSMVFGDYTKELIALAKMLDIEPVVSI